MKRLLAALCIVSIILMGFTPPSARSLLPFQKKSEAEAVRASWRQMSEEELLDCLDCIVAHRAPFIQSRQQVIDSLELQLREASANDSLCYLVATELLYAHIGFSTRELLRYARLGKTLADKVANPRWQQQAAIHMARAFIQDGQYEQAAQWLSPLMGVVYAENLRDYYDTSIELYGWKSECSSSEQDRRRFLLKSQAYRDSLLMVETDSVWRVHQGSLLMAADSSHIRQSLCKEREVLDALPPNHPHIRHLTFSIAYLYESLGQVDSSRYYSAVSALYDLTEGVREYVSLRNLALDLFDKGDVERAYHYLHCCVEDANACEVPLRMLQFSPDFPVILDAYQQKIDAQGDTLRHRFLASVLLSVLLVFMLGYVYVVTVRLRQSRQKLWNSKMELEENNRKLNQTLLNEQEANRQLQEANRQLREANRIKEAYITRYMTECSTFIDKMSAYRKNLLHIAQGAKPAQILPALRDTAVEEQELNLFYTHFDQTFLQLFPHFIEEVNDLLQPEARFALHDVELKLNTDLRVLALVRLGITDSTTIASFLHCSVKTVYNCRARLRSKAVCERNDFEDLLRKP